MNLTVSEFGTIWRANTCEQLDGGNLNVDPDTFTALRSLLTLDDDKDDNHEVFFKYGIRRGRECLRIQNYVGVIQAGGAQIEVLPKISKLEEDPTRTRAILIKMLKALGDAPFKDGMSADLATFSMPLFELVYRVFVEKTASVVRRGLARAYVRREGNLYYLRGKLRVSDDIKHNAGIASRMYCEYDEYKLDRPANRLLAAALDVTIRRSRNNDTQHRARELRFHLDGVAPSKDVTKDLKSVVQDRNISHYQAALANARLILRGLNPLTQTGSNTATAMLFPMETVFEAYVAKQLNRLYPDWDVQEQARKEYLVEEHAGRRMFALKPDLIMSKGNQRIVADTKWKLLDAGDTKNKYGISQADMYQMYAYGQKYLSDQSTKVSLLIYPKSNEFEGLDPFWFDDGILLLVTAFDLESDSMHLRLGQNLIQTASWGDVSSSNSTK